MEKSEILFEQRKRDLIYSAVARNQNNTIELTLLKQILEKYNTSVEQLEEAISLVDSSDKRLCHVPAYDMNSTSMTIDKVPELSNIDRNIYDKNLLDDQKQLSSLVEQILKNSQDKLYESESSIGEAHKTADSASSPVLAISNLELQPVLRKYKPTFYDHFYTEDVTEEEKIKIRKLVDNYMEKTTSQGKTIVIKIYGKTLDQYHNVPLDKNERIIFHSLKNAIADYIQKNISNPELQPVLRNCKPTFYDYFYTDDMTEEEKIKIKKLVDSYIKNTVAKGKTVAIKIYGITLDQYRDVPLNRDERVDFHSLKNAIVDYIQKKLSNQKGKIQAVDQSVATNPTTIQSIYEFFYEKNMVDSEKEMVQKFVDAYLTHFGIDLDLTNITEWNVQEFQQTRIYQSIQNYVKLKLSQNAKMNLSQREEEKSSQQEQLSISKKPENTNTAKISAINLEHLNYLEQLIIKLYNNGNNIDQVCKVLMISENTFIECYLKNS